MKVSGKTVIERSPAELWELLLDPDVLRRCIPGCEELERAEDDTYRVKLKVGFGVLKGRFQGQVTLKDVKPRESYRLEVSARGATGFINGQTSIRLHELDGGKRSELEYEGEAHVGGVIASVGARFFQGAARNFTAEFFEAISSL